jgi:hypothetical protein
MFTNCYGILKPELGNIEVATAGELVFIHLVLKMLMTYCVTHGVQLANYIKKKKNSRRQVKHVEYSASV